MRAICGAMLLLTLAVPSAANGQSFEFFGSAGPTLTDTGNSFAVGVGFLPTSRLTVSGAFERTHLATRSERDGNVFSTFRGGTLLLGSGELRFALFPRDRVGPYGVAGFAAGVARPNVNALFPDRVSNSAAAIFVGGGMQVPFGGRFAAFADARMMVGGEGTEGLVAVAPLRAGLAWRF